MKKKNKKKDRCVPNRRQNARQMWSHSRRFLKGKNGYHSVERDGNEWRTASAGHIQLDGCASKFLWQRHLPFCRCLFHIIYHRRSKCSASHTHTLSLSLSSRIVYYVCTPLLPAHYFSMLVSSHPVDEETQASRPTGPWTSALECTTTIQSFKHHI